MPIFRRDNDGRRVVKFPDKATAQQTISMLAKSGALSGGDVPSKKERAQTREEIGAIRKDAQELAERKPEFRQRIDSDKPLSIWNDPKPNFKAVREAQDYPSSESAAYKPGYEYRNPPGVKKESIKDPW